MITGEMKSKIDSIWNDFWAGGVANPLSVMEQMTYLLFIKRLDDLHTLEERKSQTLKQAMERRIFPEGNFKKHENDEGRPYEDLRWSRFKHFEASEMMTVVDEYVWVAARPAKTCNSSKLSHAASYGTSSYYPVKSELSENWVCKKISKHQAM